MQFAPLFAEGDGPRSENCEQRRRCTISLLEERAPIATYHHGNLRRALVVEGRKLFEENGAAELSLREVARRAGVSVAAPSRHFRGKEDLLAAIASDGFAELIKARKKIAIADLNPLEKTRAMMLSYVNFALAHEGLFSLMIGPRVLPDFRGDEFLAVSSESFNYFATSVQELAAANGWPKERLNDVTYAAWSMEHGLAALILAKMIPREGVKLRLRRIIDFAIEMLLSAVVAGPSSLESVSAQMTGLNRAATPRRAGGSGHA